MILKLIYNLLQSVDETKKLEYTWLSESSSLEELEIRQRRIQKGEAPWQKHLPHISLM